MLFKARVHQIANGIQTGVELYGGLKGLYQAGMAAFTVGTRIGAAAIPFIL